MEVNSGILIIMVIAISSLEPSESLILTNKGIPCKSDCKWNWKYFYCYYDDALNWDYCSPTQEMDSNNRRCLNDCAFHGGSSYSWCKVVGDTWGYCSMSQGSDQPYKDTYGKRCLNYCGFYGNTGTGARSKCYTKENGWSSCGFLPNQPARSNATCLKDSPCDRHEKSAYHWCRISASDWDYCSPFCPKELHRLARA